MAIDPTARVADSARIGEGVEIGPFAWSDRKSISAGAFD